MPENIDRHEENALRRQILQEASLTRPDFSERIHRRLHDEVCRRRRIMPLGLGDRPDRTRRWVAAAAVLAVSVAAGAVWLGSSGLARPSRPDATKVAEAEVVPVEPIAAEEDPWADLEESALAQLDLLVSSTVDSRWAYLDQDARSALAMLADTVPVRVEFLPWLAGSAEETRSPD
ncbi:MAG: hypothetical protein GXY83_05870 [Rhodopirellula sp.]|nr:hypothetical protein [Rhodopirellula sp.]